MIGWLVDTNVIASLIAPGGAQSVKAWARMPDRFVRLARTRLDVTDLDLARKLGVTLGCLRSWDRKGAPRYVQLALAPRNPKAHLSAE